ncbi:MAG: tetratricopeptide repeat protein, partial [Myxococcales bacterium]|nr:tetratricopeptide repeat protein [Myxococcales bacterium]
LADASSSAMHRTCLLGIALLLGCTEDPPAPPPTPPEAPPETPATTPEAPAAVAATPTPTRPPDPPPAPEAIAAAREQCNQGYTALGEGDLDTADQEIDRALAVLRRVTEPADRAILGACLYNAARVAEERLDVTTARELYEQSIAQRPNPIASRRRRELGERSIDAQDDRYEMVANQLQRATEGHPCPTTRPCDVETVTYAHSGGGRLLRAAVVAIRPRGDEDATPSYYLGFSGPRGAFRWGPRIWHRVPSPEIEYGDPTPFIAFRHARLDQPWLLFVRTGSDWSEQCCGGSAEGVDSDLAICEVTDEAARCVYVAELRDCNGRADDDADDYEACHYSRRRWVTFDAEGLEVHGDTAPTVLDGDEGLLGLGTHGWDALFPPPDPAPEETPAADEVPAPPAE